MGLWIWQPSARIHIRTHVYARTCNARMKPKPQISTDCRSTFELLNLRWWPPPESWAATFTHAHTHAHTKSQAKEKKQKKNKIPSEVRTKFWGSVLMKSECKSWKLNLGMLVWKKISENILWEKFDTPYECGLGWEYLVCSSWEWERNVRIRLNGILIRLNTQLSV